MSKIFHPLLYLLACATRQEFARQVQYLKTENEILRSKLPRRITVTPAERRKLVRAGKKLGSAIKELITIVSPRTFARWVSGEEDAKKKSAKKVGRPRTPEEIRELVVKIATETGWGYTRILGELRKLGIRKISRQTVVNILKENGFDPGPQRGKGTWDEFLKIHAKTLWACDFLSKKTWTLGGLVDMYLLVFIHIGSRRVWISAATAHPDSELRELVLKLARENAWGYTRILGELRKLGITRISRQTVKNILKAHDLDPGPKRGKGSWEEFLRIHADTLWQCDFVSKRMWTLRGFVDLYFLVFLHLGTRRCWISPCTVSPESAWVSQQARNFMMVAEDLELAPKYVMRDNDTKFTAQFDQVFETSGATIKRNTPQSPNLRAHVERFIQTLQVECLDKFVIVAPRHLNYVNREWSLHYNQERPHEARNHLPPACETPPEPTAAVRLNDVVCTTRLGGLLKSYSRRAA